MDIELMNLLYAQFPFLLYILMYILREERVLASHKFTGIIGDSTTDVSAGIVTVDIVCK